MKCAYKRVLDQRKKENDEKSLMQQERKARAHLFATALKVAETQFGFDTEQLKKMLDGMFEEASDAFQTYKDETQEDYDPTTVPFMLRGFINQLDALEVDVRAIEKEYKFPVPDTRFWSRERIQKHIGRSEILTDREVTFRAYMYAFMLYLYHEYEYEGEKLTTYYRAVLRHYYAVWAMYLECHSEVDVRLTLTINSEINDVRNRVTDIMAITDTNEETNETDNSERKGEENNG